MTDQEIIRRLRRLKVETGSLACLGCGCEHNCATRGCAIMRAAADQLEKSVDRCARYAEEIAVLQERQKWIPVTERLPGNGERVLAYCKDRVIHDVKWSWPQNTWFDKVTGHEYFESFVTRWMPRPEAPEAEFGDDDNG